MEKRGNGRENEREIIECVKQYYSNAFHNPKEENSYKLA